MYLKKIILSKLIDFEIEKISLLPKRILMKMGSLDSSWNNVQLPRKFNLG